MAKKKNKRGQCGYKVNNKYVVTDRVPRSHPDKGRKEKRRFWLIGSGGAAEKLSEESNSTDQNLINRTVINQRTFIAL